MPILVPYTFCSNWSDAPPPKTCITAHTRQRVPVVLARVSSAQNQGRASVSAARRRHARHRRPPQAARAARLNLGAPYSRANPYRHRNRPDEKHQHPIAPQCVGPKRHRVAQKHHHRYQDVLAEPVHLLPERARTCSRNPLEAKPRDIMREPIAALGGLDAARQRPPNTVRSWRRSDASLRNSFSASSSSAESAAGLRPTIR